MGKKDISKKRKFTNDDNNDLIENDIELQAELTALAELRKEKIQKSSLQLDNNQQHVDKSLITKTISYNKEGLIKSIEDLDNHLSFSETLVICKYNCHVIDENDDIEREIAFYNQTLNAVNDARAEMHSLGLPIHRPNDYFCENIKTDLHMSKIKDKLLIEEKRIESFELRKNKENNRKFNKQLIELKKQEKQNITKNNIKDTSKFHHVNDTNMDNETNFHNKNNSKNSNDRDKSGILQKSKKRLNMDKKYGFGGKERKLAKLNDKKSLNDMSDFNPRGGKFVRREKSKYNSNTNNKGNKKNTSSNNKSKSNTTHNRPGKDARNQKRQSQK